MDSAVGQLVRASLERLHAALWLPRLRTTMPRDTANAETDRESTTVCTPSSLTIALQLYNTPPSCDC
jgi:hypothetical protein